MKARRALTQYSDFAKNCFLLFIKSVRFLCLRVFSTVKIWFHNPAVLVVIYLVFLDFFAVF